VREEDIEISSSSSSSSLSSAKGDEKEEDKNSDEESKGQFVEDADEAWKLELLEVANKRIKIDENTSFIRQQPDLADICIKRGRGHSISNKSRE
jgi:hypothetical protein